MKTVFIFKILIIYLLVNFGTLINQQNNEMEITKIIYHFGGTSVAPIYHRSYTVELYSDSLSIVVDSYGTILSEKTYQLDSLQFDSIVANIDSFKIENQEKIKNRGCTGGTSESISYFSGDEKLFSGSVYHCGGTDFGDMKGDVREFAKEIKVLIPELDSLLR